MNYKYYQSDMESLNNEVTNRGIRVTKVLSAPLALVWNAWTKAEQIANWWGPDGFTNTIHTMEVMPDGEWRLTMHGPDGKTYPNRSKFLEIVHQKKIIFEHFNPNYVATIIFTSEGDQTLIDWSMVFETTQLFETVVKVFKADEGLYQNVEKLENYLKRTV